MAGKQREKETGKSRIAFLRDRVSVADKSTDKKTFAVPFRQQQIHPVLIQTPIDFPLYNVLSGRTHRAQSRYIDEHQLPQDFFNDPEDSNVQKAQHEILAEMIDLEGLRNNLIEKHQRNPLVLTYDGYVIDGNRRLAALRSEKTEEYVTAVVLPEDATSAEIYETEVELQMSQETKAAYNWIDQALHVRYGVEKLYAKQKSPADAIRAVAQRMNMSDKDISYMLERLTLADLYLEWLGEPGKYHRIPTDVGGGAMEQAFEELTSRTGRQEFQRLPEDQRRVIRETCFGVIAYKGGYKDIRRVFDTLRTNPAEVARRVQDRAPHLLPEQTDVDQGTEVADPGDGESLLDELARAESQEGAATTTELLTVVGDPDAAKAIAPVVMDVAEEIVEEQKESQKKLEPLQQLERALKNIRSMSLDRDTRRLEDIASLLAELHETVDRLTVELERARSDKE